MQFCLKMSVKVREVLDCEGFGDIRLREMYILVSFNHMGPYGTIHVYAIHYLLHIVYKISAELVQYLLQLPCHVIFIRRSADAHSIDNKNRF